MGFLHNLFGKKEQATASSNETPGLEEDILEKIWESAESFDSQDKKVDIKGVQLPLDFYMYSMAELMQEQENIALARKSRAKFNATGETNKLFRLGLCVIAGRIKSDKGNFVEFVNTCRPLLAQYNQYYNLIAENIDKGNRPSTAEAQKLSEGKKWSSRGNTSDGMSPLLDFLISYAKS